VERFDVGHKGGGECEVCVAEVFEDGFCAWGRGGGEEGLDRWFQIVYYLDYRE